MCYKISFLCGNSNSNGFPFPLSAAFLQKKTKRGRNKTKGRGNNIKKFSDWIKAKKNNTSLPAFLTFFFQNATFPKLISP